MGMGSLVLGVIPVGFHDLLLALTQTCLHNLNRRRDRPRGPLNGVSQSMIVAA